MTGWYESAGARLSFRDSGSGIPVVFLHPTPLDSDYWLPVAQALGGIRAIIPDLRGHGRSELGSNLPVGAFTRVPDAPVLAMAQLAADAIALLDHLKIAQASFVGCSIGGYVMLQLWRQIPQRMQALAFVCSKAQPDAQANLAKRASAIAQVRSEGTARFFDAAAQASIGASAHARRPEILAQLRARMTLSPQAVEAVQAGLAVRPDSLPTVPTMDVPVLAIAGGEDPAVAPAEMEAFRAAPGGCEFHLLPDAGHFAAYEQPQKVASLLAEWLRQSEI